MRQSWDDLLVAFLHDPPDKALDVPGHLHRACRYASAAVGETVTAAMIGGLPDQLASVAERVPLPTAGENGVRAVGPSDGCLTVFHPLSGEPSTVAAGRVDEDAVERAISEIVSGLDSPRDRFLAIWRLLPDRLAGDSPSSALLPADTRILGFPGTGTGAARRLRLAAPPGRPRPLGRALGSLHLAAPRQEHRDGSGATADRVK